MMLDRRHMHVVCWYRSAERAYLDQRAKPFNKMLFEPLRARGVAMAHAGLVTRGGTGGLIPGRSGAGKSTTTLACLLRGCGFLSDDYVGVEERHDGAFVGHSLFATAVLDPHHLLRFPDLAPYAEPTPHQHERKSFLPIARLHAQRLETSASIDLLLLPRIVDAAVTTVRPATRFAALFALVPPSLLSMPRPRRETFDLFVRLVERTPAVWLELGRDLSTIPLAVAQALEEKARR